MSEQDPLLPEHNRPPSTDKSWRERTASFLESPPLHKLVILLIAIDAACVLADLGYAFLSDTCTPPEGPDAPAWLEVLAHISLVITTIFLVEIPLALWAFGLRYYDPVRGVPHAGLHIFDAIIIMTTFILEVALKGRERELAALLIILRLWRLVKLVGGIAVGAGEIGEENAKELAETRTELTEVREALKEAQSENQQLRLRLASLEGGG